MKKFLVFTVLWFLLIDTTTGQITKEEATRLAFNYIQKYDWKDCLVYLKRDVVERNLEIHTIDKRITPSESSFTFFIDKYPLVNWSHSCVFLFVNIKSGNIQTVDYKWPPLDLHEWQLLSKIKGQIPETNVNLSMKNFIQNNALLSSDHCYAVIISGGGVPGMNWSRYWNDCSFIYSTLVNVYDFQDSHIKCLIADGTSSSADRRIGLDSYDSSPLDLDGDSDNDIDYSATKSNITSVFNSLSSIIGGDDHLFIFITDHGTQESGQDVRITLWGEGEYIRDDEFADEVDKINAAQISIVMEQCHSGGLIDDLAASDRVIATACDYDEPSYPMGAFTYDEFVFDWISAMAGEDPYENSVDADDNDDGIISMQEAFNYAEANDSQSETPQYYSNPDDLGYFLGLELGLYISGPSLVCSSGTEYTIGGLGTEATITWSCSYNITRVSAQGSNPCEFEAYVEGFDGSIDAILSDDIYSLTLASKDVYVGRPYVDPGTIEFSSYEGSGYCCAYAFGNSFSFTFEGPYNSFTCKLTNLAETQTIIDEFTIYGTEGELDGFVSEGTYKFWIRGTNSCGTAANWSKTTVNYQDCGGFGLLSLELVPNPTAYETTVIIRSTNEDIIKVMENENWDLQVYSQGQLLILEKPGIKGDRYVLNTSNWKEGIYFLRVNYKDKTLIGKLIVKK